MKNSVFVLISFFSVNACSAYDSSDEQTQMVDCVASGSKTCSLELGKRRIAGGVSFVGNDMGRVSEDACRQANRDFRPETGKINDFLCTVSDNYEVADQRRTEINEGDGQGEFECEVLNYKIKYNIETREFTGVDPEGNDLIFEECRNSWDP